MGLLIFLSPFLAHDLQSSSRATTCYLVEQCHLFLWYAPGRSLWCLSSPPNHCAQDDSRFHRCALAAGVIRVRSSLLLVISRPTDHYKRITIGYHRLYSHRSFKASLGIRALIALVGASAMQGSIKVCFCCIWAKMCANLLLLVVVCKCLYLEGTRGVQTVDTYDRCLRHRLHHVRLDMSYTFASPERSILEVHR